MKKLIYGATMMLLLSGCGSVYSAIITQEEPGIKSSSPTVESATDGKYYLDDGPPDGFDEEKLAAIADAVPKTEKINPRQNRPYTALGKTYRPFKQVQAYSKQGYASWYGKRYHGRPTASGEIYDMFKMTAAHPLLPIPSYVRVTHLGNGKSVVVRVNDRGPFLQERIIDLSFAAAHRLGIVATGTGEVLVEAIVAEGTPTTQQNSEQGAITDTPTDLSSQQVYIQLGAFGERANIDSMQQKYSNTGLGFRHTIHQRDGLHLFLIGPYPSESAAQADDKVLCTAGFCGFLTRAP